MIADVLLLIATFPLIYYLLAIHSSWRFFRETKRREGTGDSLDNPFTPPVSNLKPIRGVDRDAYENFASLCRQDYPDYELLFCVGSSDDPVVGVLEKLVRDFPDRRIRVIFGSGRSGKNDKVSKLTRLVIEAENDVLVINDSDVRVEPDYFRNIVAPLRDPAIGAVTCFYLSTGERTLIDHLQTIGMLSDFYAGILVAWQLDGVKFTLGPTIATRRANLAAFGGYESLENRPADDLLVGRLIAESGRRVELLPYVVRTVADYSTFGELLQKRLRWIVVMRHLRPSGHFGLLFTFGLPWALAAIALRPSFEVALGYLGGYVILRIAMTWMIGVHGLRENRIWKQLPLIPLWDALAFLIWLASFTRTSIRWRNADYRILNGELVPVRAEE